MSAIPPPRQGCGDQHTGHWPIPLPHSRASGTSALKSPNTNTQSAIADDLECWGAGRADRRHLGPHTTFFTTTHESHMDFLGAGRSNLHAPPIVGLGNPELDRVTCTAHRDLTTCGAERAGPRTGGARNSRRCRGRRRRLDNGALARCGGFRRRGSFRRGGGLGRGLGRCRSDPGRGGGGPMVRGDSELTVPSVMPLPARSIATQAVTDTPATAASQIITTPSAERSFTTMTPLCHFHGKTPSHGVACGRGHNLADRGRCGHPVGDDPGTDRPGPLRDNE